MEKLQKELEIFIKNLDPQEEKELKIMKNTAKVPPFNSEESTLAFLLWKGKISLENYSRIRKEYLLRNVNLNLFGMAPRVFGETWAQEYLRTLDESFIKPSKKMDNKYNGEYDLVLYHDNQMIKIEVKASRAVDKERKDQLSKKALSSSSTSKFWMNFQQVKPSCAEVFVFIAVWRDTKKYWVFSSKELENNRYYSKGQHRGNVGEGQIHFREDNIHDFDKYLVDEGCLKCSVINAFKRLCKS